MPGSSIGPKQFLTIFCDGQPAQSTSSELHTSFRLASGSGSIALSRLYNGTPQALDYVNYVAGIDHSYGSFPDGQSFTHYEFYYVTPGATNNGTLPPVIVSINEWMADNLGALPDPADGDYEDWFELYNPGSNAVSLAGYFLTDTLTNKFKYEIPAGYSIPAHGYLLVWADNETGQNNSSQPDLHANFNLAKSGEAIGLFTPDGILIDSVTFGGQTTDISMGRFPDGNGTFLLLTNSTPGTANIAQFNIAPVLAPIASRSVFVGELLTFSVQATDADVPAQRITFAFASAVPAGATIDATNGLFSWTANLLGTNTFSIRATDNGSPALSDTKTFRVVVTTSFHITSIELSNDVVTLRWNAVVGSRYGLEYKNSLADAGWLPLTTNITAVSNSAWASDRIGTNTQRIYRIVLQP